MSIPIIGVTPLWDEEKDSIWMLPGYLDGIRGAGGLPIILPLTSDADLIDEMCRTVDGLLFTGGQDVYPGLYGSDQLDCCGPVCKERDDMESALFTKAVIDGSLPAFGICRGLQFFNVMLGGTLYQDLPSEFIDDDYVEHRQQEPPEALTHDVEFTHGSPLRTLLGTDRIAVNSGHHQAIRELSTWFECMARSIDGLVEAAYMQVRPFVMAVQWHPECTLYDNNSKLLFKAFIRACGV